MGVRLNRKLVLEGRQAVPDGLGGVTGNWVSLGEIWADMSSRAGRDRGDEGVRTFESRHRFVMRAAPYGAPSRPRVGQRLRYGDRIFAVLSVDAFDGAGNFIEVGAREELAG